MRQEANMGGAGVRPAGGAIARSDVRRLYDLRVIAAISAVVILCAWFAAPSGLFTVDEFFYIQAAHAMAEEGALDFAPFDVAGAPALDMGFATPSEDGARLVLQYPSGYAVIAAPFFAAFGVKGLMLLNALAALATLALTFRIARRIGADPRTAAGAVLILSCATYWSTYAFAIWPHMLALAFVLAVIERALAAGEGDGGAALTAGFLTGLGQSIRIDFIVLIPAIIVWLRLFRNGPTRRASLAFLAGAAPGYAAAACLNFQKFGVFNPFTYENDHAANDPAAFVALGIGAAIILVAILAFDVRRFMRAPISARGMLSMGLVGFLVLATPPAQALLRGYWVTLVDVQAYQFLDRQDGIDLMPWGMLSFYGVDKKAFLQSIPFAVLAIPALARILRGRASRGEALLWLTAGGFATLYSWNQTDSGLGFNARFLAPLLPIAAIIAALELKPLMRGASPVRLAAAGLLCASAFLLLRSGLEGPGPIATPAALYPQLALALLLAAVLCWRLWRPAPAANAATALLTAASLGASAAIGADDFIRDRSYRAWSAEQARAYVDAVEPGSLVFTTNIILFAEAPSAKLGVAYPGRADIDAARRAIDAYVAAGRCVYAQGDAAIDWANRNAFSVRTVSLAPAFRNGPLALLESDSRLCSPGA